MKFSAEYPWMLLILPVVYGVVLFRVKDLRIGNRIGKIVTVGLRIVLLTFLMGALAGVSVSHISDHTTTVFLIDASESFAINRSDVVKQVRDALKKLPSGDRAGVVAFGGQTSVEQFVSQTVDFEELQTLPVETETNIEQGIQTALSLFPEGDGKRLVLITDGRENSGDVRRISGSLQAEQVELLVMQQDSTPDREVYLADMSVPESIIPGEMFSVDIQVESTIRTGAVLQLYNDSKLHRQEAVTLQEGTNRFTFQDKREQEGFSHYRAVIVPDEDTVQSNNEFVAYTKATEQKKVLLIEGKEGEGKEFQKLLSAAGVAVEKLSPQLAPDTLQKMNQYSTVLLENVYADDLRTGFLEHIESYVKDYGGGLIAIGGDQSFALGGYRNTALETVLPVNMDINGEMEIPKLAMAMVIDHSGSMLEDSAGKTRLQLAKEAAVAGVENLRDTDIVGVESFDDTFRWHVKLSELTDRDNVYSKIYGIAEGGGTNIFPAVKEAYSRLIKTDAELKHIILLTDGEDEYREYDDLLEKMQESKVTLSTVAVGDDSDMNLLESLAEKGNGRFYQTTSGEELSRIFAQEVFLSEGEYLVNRDFTPVITANHDVLMGVGDEGFPELKGYVGTTVKNTATAVLMEDEKECPVLAIWQYGLGTTAAFTSDVVNEWTANYAGWDDYPALWRNLIAQTTAQEQSQGVKVSAVQDGNTGVIRYENKQLQTGDKVMAVYEDADGTQQEIELHSVSGTAYEGEIPLSQVGVYNVNVRRKNGEDVLDHTNVQLTMQYSAEYRYIDVGMALEEVISETAGKQIDTLEGCFDSHPASNVARQDLTLGLLTASVVLWLLDILNRRLPMLIGDFINKWMVRWRGWRGERKHKKRAAVEHATSVVSDDKVSDTPVEATVSQEMEGESRRQRKKESRANRKEKKQSPTTDGKQLLDVKGLLEKQEERNRW
ncbi:MAG: VWA domain-containing protein [Lachnospiraceae bacterium]|nr:VWA domain-containing protein [Lachnospiraceae bacterium]